MASGDGSGSSSLSRRYAEPAERTPKLGGAVLLVPASVSDTNQDRQSSPDELTAVGDAGIVAIALGYRVVPHCAAGNCELVKATDVARVVVSLAERYIDALRAPSSG
jgi:hypothetical protein